jgi:hypothetical protein
MQDGAIPFADRDFEWASRWKLEVTRLRQGANHPEYVPCVLRSQRLLTLKSCRAEHCRDEYTNDLNCCVWVTYDTADQGNRLINGEGVYLPR